MGLGSDIHQGTQVVESVDDNCRICLEPLAKRTSVKLRCIHKYHLDCIGSAFNAKNKMQCPTCRQVENGVWLYAQPQPNSLFSDFDINDYRPEPEHLPLDLSLDMPSMDRPGPVRRDNVLPYAHDSYFDRMIPNSDRLASLAPHEIAEVFRMYEERANHFETMRLQHQSRDHLAWHANQRRLTNMSHMMYGYGGSSGGFSYGGASSSGGNGDWAEPVFANGGGTNISSGCFCGYCNR